MVKKDSDHYPSFPSLNLAFDITREILASQFERGNALDTKANFILGSATALVSTALVLQAVLPTGHCSMLPNKFLQVLPLLLLLLVYLLVIFMAFQAYRVVDYKQAGNPVEFYESDDLFKEEHTVKAEVFRVMVQAYKHNHKMLENKASWVNKAFLLLGCEAIVLAFFLSFQVTC